MELEERARDSADNCVACTSCIAVCPITKANREYKGPKLVGPAHNRMHFSDESDYEETLKLCSNCKNCDITCPHGVAVSTLNMLERGKYYQQHPEAHTKTDEMLCHGFKMADMLAGIPLARTFANIGMGIGEATGIMGTMMSMGGVNLAPRPTPRYASTYFREWIKGYNQTGGKKRQVAYFPGCYIDTNDPDVGKAFVEVMNANDIEVIYDKRWVCCGSPLVVGGYLDEAREHAATNVSIILEYARRGIPVIASCTSCALMLKSEYTELFAQSEMKEAAANVYDDFEFLAIMQEEGTLKLPKSTDGKKLIYHAPCHLRAQGMGLPALDMLQEIGVNIENADAGCCGMSGNYGFRKENYETSMKVGEKLFNTIKESGASEVVCDCGTCREQIKHATNQPTCHPIQILAKAYND